jgi:hypothetical protein
MPAQQMAMIACPQPKLWLTMQITHDSLSGKSRFKSNYLIKFASFLGCLSEKRWLDSFWCLINGLLYQRVV